MKSEVCVASPGRPRCFDLDEALDQAMKVFWEKGYEGTSLSDLTDAMGINRPSLYAAFGNKESLFRKVLDRYLDQFHDAFLAALALPTAYEVAERYLTMKAEILTSPDHPHGCLFVQGALACGEAGECIRQELTKRRNSAEDMIRKRLEKARAEGDLPPETNPADLACYLSTLTQGMAVQANGGATREQLLRVVQASLLVFPRGKKALLPKVKTVHSLR